MNKWVLNHYIRLLETYCVSFRTKIIPVMKVSHILLLILMLGVHWGISDAFVGFGGHTSSSCKPTTLFAVSNPVVGAILQTPSTISGMMQEAAEAVAEARGKHNLVLVDVPLPVTEGTELDDWPGGIRQKYSVLRPMLAETMRYLNFSAFATEESNFLYEEDSVGIWVDQGVTLISFPTTEQIPSIKERLGWRSQDDIVVLANQQFFLDPLSNPESREFLDSAEVVYKLEQLNMRGPAALPCRGVLYRQFPGPYIAARRLDGAAGGYVVLAKYTDSPSRKELEDLFMEDSKERDKGLSFQQRIQRMIPQLPS